MATRGLIAFLALASCAPVGRHAPAYTYRALGTEPFWSLEIGPREMVFTEANAPGVRTVQRTPEPITAYGGEIMYFGPKLDVTLTRARCSDGMSDRVYPDRVALRVGKRHFVGCGGSPSGGRG